MRTPLRILHTSDWHLGRALYGRKRYEEFEAFLSWLEATIRRERAEVLLVAGDVFDSTAPSNRAQALYYTFLCRVAGSCCRHVVLIGGNHDSPSFLDAPKELLRALRVHVVGAISGDPAEEVLLLRDEAGAPELLLCAVPFLRDRDIRTVEAGESPDEKERKLAQGIRDHYAQVCSLAERRREEVRAETGEELPLVVMGHLFAAGGETVEGDGVRDLYVGSLSAVTSSIFPESTSYAALGHLHVPQRVDGSERFRYSGSPLPMGFGEAGREKSVCLVEFAGAAATVTLLPVPCFRRLERLRGGRKEILSGVERLAAEKESIWLEVVLEGDGAVGDLREQLEEVTAGTGLEILRMKDGRMLERALEGLSEETLDDLDEEDVFGRCLESRRIPDEQRPELLRTYRETRASLDGEDSRAEERT